MTNIVSFASTSLGRSAENYFKTRLIGTSDCNDYVPFYSIFHGNIIIFKEGNIKVLEYSMPIHPSTMTVEKRYDRLIGQLINGHFPTPFSFSKGGVLQYVNAMRGILYDPQGNILLCLAIDKDYVMNTPVDVIKANPDYSKFIMYVTPEFHNPNYDNIRKQLEKLYLVGCREVGMDIINTTRINSWIFKNNYAVPKFKTITAQKKFLKEEAPKNLLID